MRELFTAIGMIIIIAVLSIIYMGLDIMVVTGYFGGLDLDIGGVIGEVIGYFGG